MQLIEANMFYFNFENTVKKIEISANGRQKLSATAKNKFHYMSRTDRFEAHHQHVAETIEFVKSGHLPSFAENNPEVFWQAADTYERKNGRVCSSFVVALPKELSVEQRIELAEQFIFEFADRYQFPFSCAIHNHGGAFSGQEQPHLHFMYSERHIDGIKRTPEQFFKRYNAKAPEKGGAQKLTADVLNIGQAQVQLFREKSEDLINESLKRHAPTKRVEIRGLELEVPNVVSCLSNKDYNKKHGTQLEDAPMMPSWIKYAKKDKDAETLAQYQSILEEIQRVRKENDYQRYQSYYHAEVRRLWEIEQAEKARNRGYDGPSF